MHRGGASHTLYLCDFADQVVIAMMSAGVMYYNETMWPKHLWPHHEQPSQYEPSQYLLQINEFRNEVKQLNKQVDALKQEHQETQKKMRALKKELEGLGFHNRSSHFSTARKMDLLSERVDYIRTKSKAIPKAYYMVPVYSHQNVPMQQPHQEQMKLMIEELV